MTISDKIRIYELSRDLNLENKDILEAAQKLSISVKSHSSSISLDEAKKIKNLINKKPGEKIISVNKSSFKNQTDKKIIIENRPTNITDKEKPNKDKLKNKPILIRPVNKPETNKISTNKPISSKLEQPKKHSNSSSNQSQPNLKNQNTINNSVKSATKNLGNNIGSNYLRNGKPLSNRPKPNYKSPTKPPIQLIEKPRNLINTIKGNNSNQNNNSLEKNYTSKRSDQNSIKPSKKNPSNQFIKNAPELVGAPIRRSDHNNNPNKPNFHSKQNLSNKQTSPNRPGIQNRQAAPNRTGMVGNRTRIVSNKQVNKNNPGASNKPNGFLKQGRGYRQNDFNKPGSKFNNQRPSGIRKPVSPNELMQLQKTNASNLDLTLSPHGTGSIIVDGVAVRDNTISSGDSNADLELFSNGSGNVVIKSDLVLENGFRQAIFTITATDAITAAEHAGRINLLGEVGGNALVTLTLPDATGSGNVYEFIVSVQNTSNYVIKVPDADNTITGQIMYLDEDGTAVTSFPTVAASDTITLNGGTTGGLVGDTLKLIDIATDKYAVQGTMRVASGADPATPFSATVS